MPRIKKDQLLGIRTTPSENIAEPCAVSASRRNKAYKKSTTVLQPYSTISAGNPGNASKLAKGYNNPLLSALTYRN